MSATAELAGEGAGAIGADEAAMLFAMLAGDTRLLVAVSGGPDSVALTSLLAVWSQSEGRPALHAATVDHGLRPDSATEASAVGTLCARLGVPHSVLRWEGPKPANGLQAAARAARYDLLAREAQRLGGAAIVTAHTLDDQAETLLMRMAHGSGPSGLAGMRFRSRRGDTEIVRPLLEVPKARLIGTVQAHGLAFVQDPSNVDPRFERVRWRATAVLLAGQGLDAARLGLLARRMARQEEALDAVAVAALERVRMVSPVSGAMRLDLCALAAEPPDILLRVVAKALAALSPPGEGHGRLERLEACVDALRAALREGVATRRTLSGFILGLDGKGVLTIRPEGLRRRGVHPAAS